MILPAADINPLVVTLPPITLPPADTFTEAMRFAPFTAPAVERFPPVTLPFAITSALANTLPPEILPLAEINPVMYAPVFENTATFAVPVIFTVAFPFALGMLILLLPLLILVTDATMLLNPAPLPVK